MTVLRTAYVEVMPKTDRFDGQLKRQLRSIDSSKDGHRLGKSLGDGAAGPLASSLTKAMTSVATSGGPATAGAALGVAMGAAATGGILLALGGGVLAAGIKSASSSPKVKEAWKGFGDRAKASFKDFGKPFEGPLVRAAGTFGDALARIAPSFNRMGETMAPIIDKLAPALASMAERAMPGIEKAVKASAPLFGQLADFAPKLGDAISKFFDGVASSGPGVQVLLKDLFGFLTWVIPKVGQYFAWAAGQYTQRRAQIVAVWEAVSGAAKWAWENVIKPVVDAMVGFFRDVLAPTFSWLWNNVIKPVWAGISFAIKAAWVVIQVILGAMRLYIRNVLAPVFTWLYQNVIKPVWEKGIKPVFNALGGFISKYVAPAFRAGVGAVAAAWDKVKDAASKPVKFVVDTVLNKGIIGGINFLASKVGVKDRIPPIPWPSGGGSKPTGNSKSKFAQFGDGYGIGDGLGSLLASPAKWLAGRMGLGGLVSRFGRNPLVSTLTGAAGKAKDFALTRIQQLAGELFGSGGGGSAGAGGLRSGILGVLGALRGQFGSVPIISGLRPGATTLSGNASYHAAGRAVDIAPVRSWAEFLASRFGGQLRELITPWRELNMLNGRPHRYSHAIEAQHGVFGSNAHIHAAMATGGVIREPVFGVGRSGRTYSFGERGPETVWRDGGLGMVVKRLDQLVDTMSVQPMVVNLHNGRATVAQLEAMQRRQSLVARAGRRR